MKLFDYIGSVKGELKHVNWPTKRQALAFTLVVILFSFACAYFLGFFDFLFSRLLNLFIL